LLPRTCAGAVVDIGSKDAVVTDSALLLLVLPLLLVVVEVCCDGVVGAGEKLDMVANEGDTDAMS
jgi:hypothetical protein